ncbi:hypothetical protein BST61_g11473 [Cercospora zeina]
MCSVVIGELGKLGRDGLAATLGVSGSGKSHMILSEKCQRGLTQDTRESLLDDAFMQEQVINCVRHRDQIVASTIFHLGVLRLQVDRVFAQQRAITSAEHVPRPFDVPTCHSLNLI